MSSPYFDPKIKSEQEDSYLIYAAKCNSIVIRKLVDLNVDAMEANVIGTAPSHEMARCDNADGLKELCRSKSKSDIERLISAQDGKYGYSPLHQAAKVGAVRALKYLLELGANCNSQCNSGNSPLALCILAYVNKSKSQKKSKDIK